MHLDSLKASFSLMKIVALLLLFQAILTDGYTCDSTKCKPPSCMCASSTPPGGLTVAETPQFVHITFDDAVNVVTVPYGLDILKYKNPNGCNISTTYFVSLNYTNYHLVQQLHARGQEIASHTMYHIGDPDTNQIQGVRLALQNLSMVPASDIQGFRAPYLYYSDTTFKNLQKLGFTYDCSVTVDGFDPVFPYTLDSGFPYACDTGTCSPNLTVPGLWQSPMYDLLNDAGISQASMDPDGTTSAILSLFQKNFIQHYTRNRSPMGIWLHSAWFIIDSNRLSVLKQFIEWAQAYAGDNVYFVSNSFAIDWMKNPVSASTLKSTKTCSSPKATAASETVCDGLDDDGNGEVDEGLTRSCQFPEYTFQTCGYCPESLPGPDNPTPKAIITSSNACAGITCGYGQPDSSCKCICYGWEEGTIGYCLDSSKKCTVQKSYDTSSAKWVCPAGSTLSPANATATNSSGTCSAPTGGCIYGTFDSTLCGCICNNGTGWNPGYCAAKLASNCNVVKTYNPTSLAFECPDGSCPSTLLTESGNCLAISPSPSPSPSTTPSTSSSPSVSPSITPSASVTPSTSLSPSITPSATPSASVTPSTSSSPSVSPSTTQSPSPSTTATASPSVTSEVSPSNTPSPSTSLSNSASPSTSITPSTSVSPQSSVSSTSSATPSSILSPTSNAAQPTSSGISSSPSSSPSPSGLVPTTGPVVADTELNSDAGSSSISIVGFSALHILIITMMM